MTQLWNAGGILLGWVLLAGEVARPLAYLGLVMAFLALVLWALAVTSKDPTYTYAEAVTVVSCLAFVALIIAALAALFAAKGPP
jgi:hypothetical protein